jgi:hypothetical protein
MRRFLPVLLVTIPMVACVPRLTSKLATQQDVLLVPAPKDEKHKLSACYDPQSYVEHPELIRTKYIRVNFHFMNSRDGAYNMPEAETAAYARDWIYAANSNLEKNMKMFLPHGNETPVLPIPYRYVISPDPSIPGDDGVYYHVDDTLCYAVKTGRDRNISDKRVIEKYAVRPDSVLNIFLQTHHLDSIPSPTYKPDGSGISLGSSVKVFGKYHLKPSVWDIRGILNHEIGHSLGLSHTWGGHDGCDDTPAHPNCWNKKPDPPCDTMYSNNMMDYNAHMAALTPCQIGKILLNMNRLDAMQRNILEPRWCELDTTANVMITDSVRWNGSLDLEGNIVVKETGILEIACRVSLPAEASITLYPGAQLRILKTGRLHNACGDRWEGINILEVRSTKGSITLMEGGKIDDTLHPFFGDQP